MFPTIESDLNDYYAKQGKVFRAEISLSIAAGATALVGVTGLSTTIPLRILQRSYTSSENLLTIALYEVPFTGGSSAGIRMLNRNLIVGGTPPATFLSGITATPVTPITALTLRATTSTGSAALAVQSDDNVLILKPATQYVLAFTNGGAGTATVGAGIDFRNTQPEE